MDGIAEEFHSPVRNTNIALDRKDLGVEKRTVRNLEGIKGDRIEASSPGVFKARVPIARLRNALDDEESEDKAGFRCAECAKCITCKTSSKRTAQSLREAREQQFIEESIRIDLSNRRVTANYPFLKDPVFLSSVHSNPSNYGQALTV